MDGRTTRVALIQMSCVASTEANLAKAVARVREAAEGGAKLICLPELFRAQYFCQREDHGLRFREEGLRGVDLPEDAYSGRSALLREVLLHSGGPGVPGAEDFGGAN